MPLYNNVSNAITQIIRQLRGLWKYASEHENLIYLAWFTICLNYHSCFVVIWTADGPYSLCWPSYSKQILLEQARYYLSCSIYVKLFTIGFSRNISFLVRRCFPIGTLLSVFFQWFPLFSGTSTVYQPSSINEEWLNDGILSQVFIIFSPIENLAAVLRYKANRTGHDFTLSNRESARTSQSQPKPASFRESLTEHFGIFLWVQSLNWLLLPTELF